MLDTIAIKIDTAREGLEVRRLLANYHVTGISVTHTQEDIDEIGLNCYFIGDNELFICGWESEGTPHIKKFTAQAFIDKYTPKPEIDRQEFIAQLQYYQRKLDIAITQSQSLNGNYTNESCGYITCEMFDKIYLKMIELEKQLGWEL